MKKVLAFFGAFNPPTKAHIDLAKFAMEQTGKDGVVFIPSKSSYITDKQKKSFAFSDDERIEMLCKLCENNQWMNVSNHDIFSKYQPLSYDTLKYLRDECNYEPTLLIGGDQFWDMDTKWKHVSEIAEEFGIVTFSRSIYNVEKLLHNCPFFQKIAPYVHVINVPHEYRDISSSKVRAYMKVVQEGFTDLQNALPNDIYNYIKEKYL